MGSQNTCFECIETSETHSSDIADAGTIADALF